MKKKVNIDVIIPSKFQQNFSDNDKKLVAQDLSNYYNLTEELYFNKPLKGQEIILNQERKKFFVLINEVIENENDFDTKVLLTDIR